MLIHASAIMKKNTCDIFGEVRNIGLFTNLLKRPRMAPAYYGASYNHVRFDRDLYEQETVRAIVDCIATHAAKSEALHILVDEQGRTKKIMRNSPYAKMLNFQPNPLMSGYDLKYRLISQLETTTTAMCYVQWAGLKPLMMLPIPFSTADFYSIAGGGYAVGFTDFNGYYVTVNAEDIVLLRKFYTKNEAYGDGNAPVYSALTMSKAANEGLLDALSVSNKVRGIYSQKKAMLDPEDVKKSQSEFAQRFKDAATDGGIVGVDSMEGFQPLNITAWSANAAQTKEIRDNIMRFWRINDSILMSDYTDTQWQAFYESVIEPILIQMGQAFTNICFTPRERDVGNRIIFASDVMVNMAPATKSQLIANTKDLGIFTPNEYRSWFNCAPIEGGDEIQISLNYVKQSDQSKYQVGEEPSETNEESEGE